MHGIGDLELVSTGTIILSKLQRTLSHDQLTHRHGTVWLVADDIVNVL